MPFLSNYIELLKPLTSDIVSLVENAPILFVVMAFFIVWVFCWFPLAILSAIIIKWRPNQPLKEEQKLPLMLPLYLISPLILWIFTKLTTRLTTIPFSGYGLVKDWSLIGSLALGFAIGIISIFLIFTCQTWLGLCSWNKSKIRELPSTAIFILLVAILVGGVEELIFRGFVYTQLQNVYGVWIGAVTSSLIFACLHLVWEQKETLPQLPGLWIMGMVLVFAKYIDGGSLGIPWGLHAGWVWVIACIDTVGLISYTDKVPEWLTGKYQKPLAGVSGIVCLIGTGFFLYLSNLSFLK
ncbi:MAG: type II CAAX endopeptidase family protein [Cyanobacteria bacterium P01_A01_bin.84]